MTTPTPETNTSIDLSHIINTTGAARTPDLYNNNIKLIHTVEFAESIELIYIYTSMNTLAVYPPYTERTVFKVVFSCIDGKWNKSEPIYGRINERQEETYEFN